MKEINIVLPTENVKAIVQTLGQLPTASGAYPLMMEIQRQLDEQEKSIPKVDQ